MAVDVNLTTVNSGYNTNIINNNFTAIKTALQDVLSRSGATPNTMSSDFDMNSQDILNIGSINAASLVLNGSAVVPSDLMSGSFIALDGSTTPTADIPFGSNKATGLADPEQAQDAATKNYVDTPNTNLNSELIDASNAVNTTGKVVGKMVFDTTNNRLMVASGSGATDPWYVADGSSFVTPS